MGTDIGSDPASMTLDSDPLSDQIMLSVMEDNSDIHFIMWDGSSWGTDNQLESSSGETKIDHGDLRFEGSRHSVWIWQAGA